jgi:site-specific DNA-cytosine methylase
MKVLVACEYSGRVRDAFRQHGHDAWSCDILECEADSTHHYQGPVEDILNDGWDLMVAHPPCTHLAVSGSRHFPEKIADGRQQQALDFVRLLMDAPIDRWAIENPISVISSAICKPDQIIQPWQYGHGEVKATCLWLKNLPKLVPTNCVEGREQRIHKMPPSPDRWKERSRTFEGVAQAMGEQWGNRQLTPCENQLSLLVS